ncbi:PREDICTED: aldose reductase-like [Vollenhovia emeryi]|uniref:aldose reductase-like n=1 Tax=Vollenhovia emeryi TaxID=411798 RepID=UPI0005F444E3|nr:PREDICTED: aldose reductase-like [Vollenhovia emeryi]
MQCRSSPKEDITQLVEYAIDKGYRHFDCAHCYGNEKEVGAAINAKIREGVVKREDLFITSKLWNTFHSPNLVEPAIKQTLADLGLDYIDLYLIHWPFGFKEGNNLFPLNPDGTFTLSDVDYLDTWKAMEGLLAKGLTKNIGVSNFNSEQIARLLKNATVKPVTNQIECHPCLTQNKLSDFCMEKGILITVHSPYGSHQRSLFDSNNILQLLYDRQIRKLERKYLKSEAQLLIRYQLDRGHIVIPKSSTKLHIADNLDVFDFELSVDEIIDIDQPDCNGRLYDMKMASASPYYPFHIPF